MIAMRAKEDVIANNLANLGTAGFQKDTLIVGTFADLVNDEMGYEEGELPASGYLPVGGGIQGNSHIFFKTATQFSQGSLKNTGNPFDLGVDGEGFFAIQSKEGVKLTRNGSFNLDADGRLITKDGSLVLGEHGPIKAAGTDLKIKETGEVMVDGKEVGRLKLFKIDPKALVKVGENYFMAKESVHAVPAKGRILQGFLEMSNVNAVKEMVDMLAVMRAFEANQKLMHSQDQMTQKSVNEVGKVR